jgi:hypothetical protein
MYNQAAKDRKLAEAIASAVKDAGSGVILMGLAGSEFVPATAPKYSSAPTRSACTEIRAKLLKWRPRFAVRSNRPE